MKGSISESGLKDFPSKLEIGPPFFDDSLQAWVLSRYSDVLAAFHCPGLYPSGLNRKPSAKPPAPEMVQKMRRETREALSPSQLRIWRKALTAAARARVKSMNEAEPVDLVGFYSRPLSLMLAALATGIETQNAERLYAIAEPISASAAEPYDPTLKSRARPANAELGSHFQSGPESLRGSGFVALAHTLPCLLANAWYVLLQSPSQWRALHRRPGLTARAVEELLRCAELPRILFRQATWDMEFNGAHIRKGQRIVLRVAAANRDAARFIQPNRVDIQRRRIGQLALGAGPHSCVGAGLIRMAAVSIMYPLLERFPKARLIEPVKWKGGSGFRYTASLWVRFGREQP